MHMTLADITAEVTKSAAKVAGIGKTIKLELDEGVVFIDLTTDEAVVSNENKDADATITTTLEILEQMSSGDINPMMAVMTGKIKIKGDMGAAMKLQSIL